MKVLIIEDERLAAEKLEKLLDDTGMDIEVLDVLETVEGSINWIASNPPPDLIFMDIQLDDGVCFEIFESEKVNVPVIFTTAYDEYAIRAFKVNSIDYLLKPIDLEALKKALDKYLTIYTGNDIPNEKINDLYEHLVKKYKTRFFVKIGVHYHTVPVEDIACFFIQERSTFLKTIISKNYDLDYSLDQIQKMINPEQFYRINRNYIVNLDSITDIIGYSSNRLRIKLKNFDHLDLIVSRDKTTEFKRWLDR
ncbi:LytR/AlgR family response regulator transcription factor [Bacteroidota bacterium]